MTDHWNDWMRDVCAVRYALSQRTYIANTCAEALAKNWKSLHPKARQLIARELREEIERDDISRADQSTHNPLGDDYARQAWLRLMRTIEVNEGVKKSTTLSPEVIRRLDIYIHYQMQARELTNKKLALRFEVSERTIISALKNGSSKLLTDDDIKMIYNCRSERDRLKSIAAEHSPNALVREGLAEKTEIHTYLHNHNY